MRTWSDAVRRGLVLGAVLGFASVAHAHQAGFHKRLTITASKYEIEALVVMDMDAGERALLLRSAADVDHDGRLDDAEAAALKDRLVRMATRALELSLGGAPLPNTVVGSKLSLREDFRAADGGLSVAVHVRIRHPLEVVEGMSLGVKDTAPDFSAIHVEVFQSAEPSEPASSVEVKSGAKHLVRLGRLLPVVR